MNTSGTTISLKSMALTAGIGLLVMAIIAGFSYGYIMGTMVLPGDWNGTLYNVTQSPFLFRLGIAGFLGVLVLDILVAWALYLFFQHAGNGASLLTAWFRLVYTAFLGIALSSLAMVPLVANGSIVPLGQGADYITTQVAFLITSFETTWSMGLIIFGVHLLGLAYLAFKSEHIHWVIALLLVIAALGYLATNKAALIFEDYKTYKATVEAVLAIPMTIGEMALALWLVVTALRGKYD